MPGIVRSIKEHEVAAGFALSFGRETAPRDVIEAPPGLYHITTGHTGTSITEYIEKASSIIVEENIVAEIEADHLIVGATTAEAVARLIGRKEAAAGSKEVVEASLSYNFKEIDEAVATSKINSFTVDTCSLINFEANSLPESELDYMFEEVVPERNERLKILDRYTERTLIFPWIDGSTCKLRFSDSEVKRLTVKYNDSLKASWRVYSYIKNKMNDQPFGFEIAFDETPFITNAGDLYFYLSEWKWMGGHAEFVAPNIGFEKRIDYEGDLDALRKRVSNLAAVAYSLGSTLSIHSTSGSTPSSLKGFGVYDTIRVATGGRVKTKISGIYYELLLEILFRSPNGSKRRRLYDEIFDSVMEYLNKEVKFKGPLYSDELISKIEDYKRGVSQGKIRVKDPLSALAKSCLFLALNIRDALGRRYIRDAIIKLYYEDNEFRKTYDLGVKIITDNIIEKFGFQGNLKLLA